MAANSPTNWSFSFSGFGQVSGGSIEMTPLVVLVGPNNSGKSYIASLIWSLFDLAENYISQSVAVPEWLSRATPDDYHAHKVALRPMEAWTNEQIAEHKDRFVRQLLAFRGAALRELRVHYPRHGATIRRLREERNANYILKQGISVRPPNSVELQYTLGSNQPESIIDFRQFLRSALVDICMYGDRSIFRSRRSTYLPAARTGLLLALPFILDELLSNLESDEQERVGQLNLPTSRFLRQVIGLNHETDGPLKKIAEFLEKELVHGRIRQDAVSKGRFSYEIRKGLSIPLHAASSMVSELAPLLLLLRHADLSRGIVFEEPESHLHLSAQRVLARAVARIVNAGVPIVLTTHSDTFIQQLNVLIALNDHPNRDALMKRYNYEESDLISRNSVSAYEFKPTQRGSTKVKRAELIDEGLVVTSLNDVIVELSSEANDSVHQD